MPMVKCTRPAVGSFLASRAASQASGCTTTATCLSQPRSMRGRHGAKEAPEKPQKVDQAKVAHQVRQALNARQERHWRALPAREGNQVHVVERVRGDNTQEEKGSEEGQAAQLAAQEDRQENPLIQEITHANGQR